MATQNKNHGALDIASLDDAIIDGGPIAEFPYKFENFFHPFVGELIGKLNKESLPGMLDPSFLASLKEDFFRDSYLKDLDGESQVGYYPKQIDLSVRGPYANYNWELFFHIPLTIAVHLSKNQRFAEAQRWFHYIFDPTCNDPAYDPPQRYWKFLRFRQPGDAAQVDELLALLSKPDAECTRSERDDKEDILAGYEEIKRKPFQPHAVARTRHLAYQYCVVMKYLDNLIAWGDSLFRQDAIESINEATQLYVLAANLLGARPQRIPPRGTVRPKTFYQIKAQGLDPMGNALVELEGKFPFNLGLPQTRGPEPDAAGPLFGIGRTLYFCIPHNDKLLSYWDTVADRLFKIRHCMTIEGVVRQLALFDPPIDPGMLVKAAAVGIDIGSIISGLNQPISPVRTPLLIQKALELCAEVRGLGAALLAAIEKGDSEHLALLRQGHEIKIQEMQQEVRFLQWKQAQESTEALLRGRSSTLERYDYYLRLLGQTREDAVPDTFTLDRPSKPDDPPKLTEENFDETYETLVGQYDIAPMVQAYPPLKLAGEASPANQSGASGKGQLYLNSNEDADLNEHTPTARDYRNAATVSDNIHTILALIPDMGLDLHFWGLGGHAILFGGSLFSAQGRIISSRLNTLASNEDSEGASASKTAGFERRADDWILQCNLTTRELAQIGRQIIGSLIAEQIAHHEYHVIKKQIEHSQEIDNFLQQEEFTTEQLYAWMQGELSRLYYEYYRFAFDTARKAEQTMKRELMRPELDATDYVKFNYWDGGRKGLLSGEALYLDVKRLEMAYHENNKREYELTKHVSLLQVNPLALLQLRATGRCTVFLPEELFDMDGPGHYFRRIKSVAVSIPCVTGPYASVNCTLTLLKSSIRKTPALNGDYARENSEDARFHDYFGNLQSIVTSSAQNDSGMFETNLRDERYLPFEGAGVIGEWQLKLPANPSLGDPCQFDYDTISDVILHLRYTAREGGDLLRRGAIENLKTCIAAAQSIGSVRLFSVRHEFPTEWARFQRQTANANEQFELVLNLREEHYPFWSKGKLGGVQRAELLAKTTNNDVRVTAGDVMITLGSRSELGNTIQAGQLPNDVIPSPTGEYHLHFTNKSMEELWLAVTWGTANGV